MIEKGEERKRTKEDRFQVLKEQVEEEKAGRNRLLDMTDDIQTYLKESLALDKQLLGLRYFSMCLENKRGRKCTGNEDDE